MIQDSFGRTHDYLRVSLTDKCNLRCFYCMPEEKYAFAPAASLMQADEIEVLARLFVAQGVKKIRLTGGEPLVRRDAPQIIEALGKLNIELAITTNGIRIHEMLPELMAADIRTVNVSLDTLQREKFITITRRDLYHRVRSNIELLLHHGIRTKINVVVMKGLNDDEINDFIVLTREYPLEIRFIEFMPFTGNRWTGNQVITLSEILETIQSRFDISPASQGLHDTARNFSITGHQGSFGIISTMSAPFCDGCNRLRLTADGKLKNCLFSKTETDLLSALRAGEEIVPLIVASVKAKSKALGGQMDNNFKALNAESLTNRSMISIGG